MTDTSMLAISGVLVATLFGLLTTLIGWGGSKVISRLDSVVEKLDNVSSELHERINGIDIRVSIMETKCTDRHK